MPFVVAFAYYLLKYSWKKITLALIATILLMQLVNLPWIVRNNQVLGSPVLYTTNNSYVYRSFNSSATPEGGGHIPSKGEEGYSEALEQSRQSGDPVLYHKLCGEEIRHWILNHPGKFLLLGTSRAIYFMGWDRGGGMWPIWLQFQGESAPTGSLRQKMKDTFEEAAYAYYYGILFSFLLSLILIWRRWKGMASASKVSLLVLGSCLLFWLAEHMIIYPDRKYRFPLEPIMIIAGSFFIDWLLCEFRWRVPFTKKSHHRSAA